MTAATCIEDNKMNRTITEPKTLQMKGAVYDAGRLEATLRMWRLCKSLETEPPGELLWTVGPNPDEADGVKVVDEQDTLRLRLPLTEALGDDGDISIEETGHGQSIWLAAAGSLKRG